jgi:hypothetical protein
MLLGTTLKMSSPNPQFDLLLKQQEMESSKEYAKKVRAQMQEEFAAGRKIYETFHINLALFSSGTLALSVTYLGYLRSSGGHVLGLKFLIASWTCLLCAIPLSLFVSFLHTHYYSFGRIREYQNAMSAQKEAEADAIMTMNVVNLMSEELPAERDRLLDKAKKFAEEATIMQRKENLYCNLWRLVGYASRILFVAGLAFLYIFAVRNALQ